MSTTTEVRTTKKRSVVAPSNVMVTKTPVGSVRMSMGPSNVIERTTRRVTYAGAPTIKAGIVGQVTKDGVNNVLQTRDKERQEMTGLNTKLANYIEQVNFMEGTCKALTAEIERLKKTKGYDQARVADLYKEEMQELRDNNAELEKKLAPLDSKIIAKDDEIETLAEKIKDLEAEIDRLNDRVRQLGDENGDLEGECKKLKNDADQMASRIKYLEGQLEMGIGDNKRLRHDLEEAITAQIDANERAKDAEEELDFLKQATDEEISELKEIINKLQQNPVDVKKMWKQSFGSAISNLQEQYRDDLARCSDEMRRQYEERMRTMQMGISKDNTDAAIMKSENQTLKSQMGEKKNRLNQLEADNESLRRQLKQLQDDFDEAREECDKEKDSLRQQIEILNEDIQEMMAVVQGLEDKKMSLELEIATYRKLLEGEEKSIKRVIEEQHMMQSRGGADLSHIIMGGGGGSSMQSTMSESTGRINVKKTSKCAVSIADLAHDGSCVKLDNTSATKDFDLSNWSLERIHPKGRSFYQFPANYTLKKGQSVKIFGADFDKHKDRGRDDIVAEKKDCPDWGYGNGSFSLKDTSGVEKASSVIEFK